MPGRAKQQTTASTPARNGHAPRKLPPQVAIYFANEDEKARWTKAADGEHRSDSSFGIFLLNFWEKHKDAVGKP